MAYYPRPKKWLVVGMKIMFHTLASFLRFLARWKLKPRETKLTIRPPSGLRSAPQAFLPGLPDPVLHRLFPHGSCYIHPATKVLGYYLVK